LALAGRPPSKNVTLVRLQDLPETDLLISLSIIITAHDAKLTARRS
jgi:hypothetical protein